MRFKEEEKEYVEINERIKIFNEKYPDYSILTNHEIFEMDGKVYAKVEAAILKEGNTIRTGTAMKEKDSNDINKFSFLENAETSAIGRALSFLGIAATNVVASKDEVEDAKASLKESEKKETVSKGKKLTAAAKTNTKKVDLDFITDKRTKAEMKKITDGLKKIGLSSVIMLPAYNRYDKDGKYDGLMDFLTKCDTSELKRFIMEDVMKK